MKTTEVPANPCPVCQTILDRATDPTGGASPNEGDATVCIRCGAWLIFEGGKLRTPTPDELAVLEGDPDAVKIRDAVMTVARMHRQ